MMFIYIIFIDYFTFTIFQTLRFLLNNLRISNDIKNIPVTYPKNHNVYISIEL